jgi:hypothetical protein
LPLVSKVRILISSKATPLSTAIEILEVREVHFPKKKYKHS